MSDDVLSTDGALSRSNCLAEKKMHGKVSSDGILRYLDERHLELSLDQNECLTPDSTCNDKTKIGGKWKQVGSIWG